MSKKAKKHHLFDRVLVEDMLNLANAELVRKKYRRKKHARALWRLAMVEKLVLERMGLWK